MSNDISLSSFTRTTSEATHKLMENIYRRQRQIDSQERVEKFSQISGMNNHIEAFLSLKTEIEGKTSNIDKNSSALRIMSAVETSIGALVELASDVRVQITNRINASGNSANLNQLAKGFLGNIQAILNTRYEGEYIFSGSRTDAAPVKNIIGVSNVVNGVVTDNYYTGNDNPQNLVVTEGFEIEYGVKANEKAFKYLISSLHKVIAGDTNNDVSVIQTAMTDINIALDGLNELRTLIGNNSKIALDINERLNTQKINATKVFAALAAVDPAQAMTEVMSDMNTLTAAYTLTSKILPLQLANYLK